MDEIFSFSEHTKTGAFDKDPGKAFWWRRGESNPCPKSLSHKHLRAQCLIFVSAEYRSGTNYLRPFRCGSRRVTGRRSLVSCWLMSVRGRRKTPERHKQIKLLKQNHVLRLLFSTVLRGGWNPGSLLVTQQLLSKPVRPRCRCIVQNPKRIVKITRG